MGIFRFWRDAGYAIGALLTGILADAFGLGVALAAIGGLTVLSELLIQWRMYCPSVIAPVVGSTPGACARRNGGFPTVVKMEANFGCVAR